MMERVTRLKQLNRHLECELMRFYPLPEGFNSLVGQDRRFRDALALAARVAARDTTVLIRGESGTGKDLVARAIHAASHRSKGPFVRVNCAAIPENLLESEMFGYEGGAFTGARREGKPGKFELAEGGTIFLDEIGDVSPAIQAKLLRVLQEREFERLGGTKTIHADVRIIAATNRDLEALMREGKFREDLYYRINVISIYLPPLRERNEDIWLLVDHILRRHESTGGRTWKLSTECMDLFQRYRWPGNVRELENVLEYAVTLAGDTEVIALEHLPEYLRRLYPGTGRAKTKQAKERDMLLKALEAAGNNRSRAMKLLGISRRTFYKKLKKYGLMDRPIG